MKVSVRPGNGRGVVMVVCQRYQKAEREAIATTMGRSLRCGCETCCRTMVTLDNNTMCQISQTMYCALAYPAIHAPSPPIRVPQSVGDPEPLSQQLANIISMVPE